MKQLRKQLRPGRPRDLTSPVVDKSNPDNFPSLIKYLEANGKIKHTSYAVMLKARNMFLKCVSPERICKILDLSADILDRWILCFSWEEERDRRMFEQFRKVSGVNKMYGDDIGKRHDRIAGTIEQVAERLLQKHANGLILLSTQDLARLTSVVKATQDIRRTARNESDVKKSENNVNVNFNIPHSMERIASALVDMYDRPKLVEAKTKTIALGVEGHIGRDSEYEHVNGQTEERDSQEE